MGRGRAHRPGQDRLTNKKPGVLLPAFALTVDRQLQGRARARQYQPPDERLLHWVTRLLARDQKPYDHPTSRRTSERQSLRAAIPVTDRSTPLARPVKLRLAQSACADDVMTMVVAENAAAAIAPQRNARAIIVLLPDYRHGMPTTVTRQPVACRRGYPGPAHGRNPWPTHAQYVVGNFYNVPAA